MSTIEVEPRGRIKHILNIVLLLAVIPIIIVDILLLHLPNYLMIALIVVVSPLLISGFLFFLRRGYRSPYRIDVDEEKIVVYYTTPFSSGFRSHNKDEIELVYSKRFFGIFLIRYSSILKKNRGIQLYQSNLASNKQWSETKVSKLVSEFITKGYKTRRQPAL